MVSPVKTSLFVTDYTANPNIAGLPQAWAGAPWSKGLADRILRIDLQDDQAGRVKDPGYYLLRSLRLHRDPDRGGGRQLCGILGGRDRLIQKINIKGQNPHLEALLTLVPLFSTSYIFLTSL
jgi:hypothetical protein